jgi:hypothetical protein
MCDYVIRQETIDYAEYMPAGSGQGTHNVYCQRAPQFWVQSTISQHNSHACSHHLARIVREIEEAARPFDVLAPIGTPEPDVRYALSGALGVIKRMTPSSANYARVTVKPYTRKAH